MPKIYVIGDTHFGHKLIADFRGFDSIEEHDEAMIDNWNSVARKRDTVWHLGDVAFGQKGLKCLDNCNGVKKLVMGNHDKLTTRAYLRYFNKIYGTVKFKNVVMSHVPIHPNELCYRWEFNCHGHIHHKERLIDDPRYMCVNADIIGLKPILFDEVVERMKRLRVLRESLKEGEE